MMASAAAAAVSAAADAAVSVAAAAAADQAVAGPGRICSSACMMYNGCVIEIVSLLCRQKSSAAS
jgi:hypothetical protein